MDEFNFDDDVTFSTNINSIKNNNSNNYNQNNNSNNYNNKSHYIDEILNYNEDSYKPNNFLSDKEVFPCESNKCKKYTLDSITHALTPSYKVNKNKIIKSKKNKKDKSSKNNIIYYILIIILFILFNNYDLCLFLQNKGFSYYKSLIFRLFGFLVLFYIIDEYIIT